MESGADRAALGGRLSRGRGNADQPRAIYQSLYVQGRGALRRELTACLRTGRALRVPRARTQGGGKAFIAPEVMISRRPAEADDRAVPAIGKAT